ncbi:MAG: peptidoglycan D,D-transpeptidase FtsI family protein [Capsulimonadaceae bacterium]
MARARKTSTRLQVSQTKSRTVVVFAVFALAYCTLACRLAYLQVVRHNFYQSQGDQSRRNKSILPARRGLIFDRNGEALAVNLPAAHIYADPGEIKDPAQIPSIAASLAAIIAPAGGRDANGIERALTRNPRTHYVSLLRHASIALGNQVSAANLPGIHVGPDTSRSYPNGPLAAQVLGFTDGDMNGVEGVEHSQDSLLEGHDGLIVGEVDQKGRFLPGTIRTDRDPVNGHDLTLTIDKTLQGAADAALTEAVKQHHADHGVVVIMDPDTGEILALSNEPGYDPNSPRVGAKSAPADVLTRCKQWRDSAVSDLYEPGSTMKTITATAVLQDEGLGEMNHHVYCSGSMVIGNHVIHCAKDPPYYGVHGDEDLRGVLKESCNVGMAQFGLALGADRLFDFEQKFGFLDEPNSGLPGEVKSHLLPPTEFNRFTGSVGWSKIQLANVSFGQGISVSPLQLATAYCAIANGGFLMQPHIVRAIGDGTIEHAVSPHVVRRVMDPEVAAAMRSILGTVVQEGTGKPAQIAGFSVGGKTGSAQVAGGHGYEAGHYVSSFIGMVPLSHPRFVILCSVFEPQGVHWGAAVAAPVVHDLAKIATIEMHLTPDDPGAVDWVDHLHPSAHQARVASLNELLKSEDEDDPDTSR